MNAIPCNNNLFHDIYSSLNLSSVVRCLDAVHIQAIKKNYIYRDLLVALITPRSLTHCTESSMCTRNKFKAIREWNRRAHSVTRQDYPQWVWQRLLSGMCVRVCFQSQSAFIVSPELLLRFAGIMNKLNFLFHYEEIF